MNPEDKFFLEEKIKKLQTASSKQEAEKWLWGWIVQDANKEKRDRRLSFKMFQALIVQVSQLGGDMKSS